MSFFDYPGGDSAEIDGGPGTASFLADASDADWDAIRAHGEVRSYRAGETVVGEGDCDRALFIIVSGTLEAVVHGRRGRDRRVSAMEAGTVLGEVGFFDGRPRSAAVRAATDARLLRLSFDAFEHLAAKEPALGRAILLDIGRVLAGRLRTVEALTAPGLA